MISISKLSMLPILLLSITTSAQAVDPTIFTIGNSLTWDTVPSRYATNWHIDCNQNLQSIYDNPDRTCVPSSITLSQGLTQNTYDFVTVQPFVGTFQNQDVAIISEWMTLQPDAIFVIHAGWTTHANHTDAYNTPNTTGKMDYSPAYFADLIDDLKAIHPTREIRFNPAFEALELIKQDISNDIGPYTDLSDVYRDDVHLTITDGRYLMHNLMRTTLGLPLSATGFETVTPQTQAYMNAKIEATTLGYPQLLGDTNDDQLVNAADLDLIKQSFGQITSLGDANHDGSTDLQDLFALRNNYPPTPAAAIPEPASLLSLMALSVIAMTHRSDRR